MYPGIAEVKCTIEKRNYRCIIVVGKLFNRKL